ncbi:MAG: type II and III secretion system protein [bacterium]
MSHSNADCGLRITEFRNPFPAAKPGWHRLLACGWMVLFLTIAFTPKAHCERNIEIATEIFEYRIDDDKQLGIFHDWTGYRGDLGSMSIALPGTERIGDDPLTAIELNIDSLSVLWGVVSTRLIAAVREGRAKLISNPTSIVLEGEIAQITSGESFPITQFTGQGTVQKLSERQLNTGVKLYVTPAIFRDEYVVLSIQAESSEIREQLVEFVTPDGRRYELPQLSKRVAQTVVILRSGQSFYIGGLIQESDHSQVRSVPVLSSVPLFGRAFRGTSRQRLTAETVFKLTPTILEPGQGSSFYQRLLGEQEQEPEPEPSMADIVPSSPDASYLTSPGAAKGEE